MARYGKAFKQRVVARLLRFFGTLTRLASMICPSMGIRPDCQRFAEKPQGLDIGNIVVRIQTENALEREAITHLVLGLIVREIVQRLHH